MRQSGENGGFIMQLQNFSVNDGAGIRTNIFLAGCPLRCQWCCNPEGQTQENAYVQYMSVDEVLSKIKPQMIFYRFSGGGVTFSGGEATAQPAFLRALAAGLYDKGVSLALESCGCFDFEAIRDILLKMDLLFMDIKHMDERAHQFFTGAPLRPILENMRRVYALGVPLCVRIPVILGVNATEKNLKATFDFVAKELPGTPVELLPYHSYGADKYEKLGMAPPSPHFQTPSPAQMEAYAQWATERGVRLCSYR